MPFPFRSDLDPSVVSFYFQIIRTTTTKERNDRPSRASERLAKATRFENTVGFLDLVVTESLMKKQILERFFNILVARLRVSLLIVSSFVEIEL